MWRKLYGQSEVDVLFRETSIKIAHCWRIAFEGAVGKVLLETLWTGFIWLRISISGGIF
jgi:hypothetical protein